MVNADLGPGEGFEQFFEGTVTAGQGDECVGEFAHPGFAGVHIGGYFQVRQVGVDQHGCVQAFRDDAGDIAACAQHPVR